MPAAAALTYTTLTTDLLAYAERSDAAFTAQIPRFIMLAEQRIASEARGLGLIESVQDVMIVGSAGSALTKPSQWRETASLSIGIGTGFHRRTALRLRSYEYCRYYAPDETLTDQPRYYADWDWKHFLIAPSPDLAYPYELLYYRRPVPLSSDNTTNWTTQFAPQLLLFASLLEASAWVKNAELIKGWQEQYDRALKQVDFESKRRMQDRAVANPNASA